MNITCCRFHDFSAGHRVYGHEGKCKHFHGHNYRVHFTLKAEQLDSVGRVLDFSVIKNLLCVWLEEHWDHRFLIWAQDPIASDLKKLDKKVVLTTFNPTAENMAEYLLMIIAPKLLKGTNAKITKITVEETRKCSATAGINE